MARKRPQNKKRLSKTISIRLSNGMEQSCSYGEALNLAYHHAHKLADFAAAEQLTQQLLGYAPRDIQALLILCYCQVARYRNSEALDVANRILKMEPGNFAALTYSAAALMYLGDDRKAIEQLKRVLHIKPKAADITRQLALAYSHIGDRDNAEKHYARALHLDPKQFSVYYDKAHLSAGKLAEQEVANLFALLATPPQDPSSRSSLEFAAAIVCRHRGELSQEFTHLTKGNQLMAQLNPWNYAEEQRHFQDIKSFVDRLPAIGTQATNGSPIPIFIASLPRAGSTLIETILSCHSELSSCGESGAFSSAVQKLASDLSKPVNYFAWGDPAAMFNELSQLRDISVENWQACSIESPYFIEKSINNIQDLGIQLALFERTKAIEIRRHPLDSILSAYQLIFARGQAASYSLESLARNYLLHRDLMAHWKQLFPSRIITIDYHELVVDTQLTLTRCLNFLGLPWEDGCLEFYKRTDSVATASSWQVRQPIHRGSLHRWKPYREFLQPAIDILSSEVDL